MTEPLTVSARNGELTATCGPRHLHSRFSPSAEAARFVRDQIRSRYRTVIVIGPGLGYCFRELRSILPEARLIGCSLSSALCHRLRAKPDALWHPESPVPLAAFLTRELSDLDSASVRVMEWAPVVECFPEHAAEVRQAITDHLRRGHASLVTQGASGRRWLRNRVFNLATITPVSGRRRGAPIAAAVLVGAGPSAEDALPLIRRVRDRVELCVTSSALEACLRQELVPDIVVVTDAAPYAAEHLRAVAAGPLREVAVAAPLSATRGIAGCQTLLPVTEDDPLEKDFFARSGVSVAMAHPHGTVAATAAELLRHTGPMPIVCIGLDFAWHAGRSHARPHLSETYRRLAASRTASESSWVYGQTVEQQTIAEDWTTDTTLDAYARWFAENGRARYSPIQAINPSPALRGIRRTTADEIARLPETARRLIFRREQWPSRSDRRLILTDLLRGAFRMAESARQPPRPGSLEREQPELAALAMRLACPELLRWYRADGPQRSERWRELRSQLGGELRAAERAVP